MVGKAATGRPTASAVILSRYILAGVGIVPSVARFDGGGGGGGAGGGGGLELRIGSEVEIRDATGQWFAARVADLEDKIVMVGSFNDTGILRGISRLKVGISPA